MAGRGALRVGSLTGLEAFWVQLKPNTIMKNAIQTAMGWDGASRRGDEVLSGRHWRAWWLRVVLMALPVGIWADA